MAAPVDAGSIYSEVRIRLDKLTADIGAVKTGFDKMGKNIQASSNKTEKTVTSNFKKIGLAGTAAIAAITIAFKKSLTVFAQTEQSLANVKAVSNATAKEFRLLEEAAENAGTTTRFTAGQAADALFFLSSAGLDAKQSVEALDGVLQLAGATGSDLAQSAQAVTSTLSQFSLEAEDAAKVSNIFAAANSNSQATLDKLQGALRQVGAVAGALDIPLEEVTGSLQALFNAGFQGESAGRALKSALADLANEASPTVKKLKELGISFNDVNPEVVGLTGAIGALEKANISTAQTIDAFGKVAGGQLVTLIKTGQKGLEDYTAAVTGTSEAARQYAVQNDTLAGSFDAFKSATEGAGNSLQEQLAPIFRIILDLGAGILRLFTKLPEGLKALGGGAAVAAGGALALSKALALVGIAISTGPLAVIAGIGAVIVGFSTFIKRTGEIKQQKAYEEFNKLGSALGFAGQALDQFVGQAAEVNEQLIRFNDFGGFDTILDSVTSISRAFGLTRKEIIEIGIESGDLSDEYTAQLETLRDQITAIEEQAIARQTLTEREKARQQAELDREQSIARFRAKAAQEEADKLEKKVDREKRLIALKKEALTIDELINQGAISEAEGLENKIQLREEEISLLTELALTQDGATDQIVTGIKKQNDAIKRYQSRLKELDDDIKAKAASQATAIITSNQLIVASRQEAIDEQIRQEEELNTFIVNRVNVSTGFQKEASETLTQNLKENWKDYTATIIDLTTSLVSGLADLRRAEADAEIAEIGRVLEVSIEDLKTIEEATILSIETIEEEKKEAYRLDLERINDTSDNLIDAIDRETEALLISLGLQDLTKIESLQKQLDESISAGDLEKQNELEKEIEKTRILEDAELKRDKILEDSRIERENAIAAELLRTADAEKAELLRIESSEAEKTKIIEEAENAQAQIKYEADLAAWESAKLTAIFTGAQSAISAFSSLAQIPVVGPALGAAAAIAAGVLTVVNVSKIDAARPSAPSFATGGIVLPTSGSGDSGSHIRVAENGNMETMFNAGADGFPMVQQFVKALNAEGGKMLTVVVNLNGTAIAKDTARQINNGTVKIDARI